VAFIPFYDGEPLRHIRRAYVTYALIAANILVFFIVQDGRWSASDYASAVSYGVIPATFSDLAVRPSDLDEIPDFLTLLTYGFLHGDLWHLFGNMIFLWVFADNVEDSLGRVRFLIFYFLSLVGAGYAYVLAEPQSEAPVIGASGAVAGVIAAYLILHPFAKVWILALGRIPLHLSAFWVLGFWILFQLYQVVFTEGGEIAWWTHIGGFLTGALVVLLLKPADVPLFARPEPAPEPLPELEAAEVDDLGTPR